MPRGKGIAGWVLEHGESLLIPDAYADERFFKDADRQTGYRTRSILCAPLKRDGKVIGVLQILNPREKESFDEQDLDGFTAYANLTATAIEKLRSLEQMRQQERVQRDLSIASEIQQELLSRAIPEYVPGAAIAAHNEAASNVGGDFYDVFVGSPYEIYFSIGDVSGKGIPAALLMAQTLSAMQFVFAATTSPSNALAKLNDTLHERIVRGMFVTTIIGRITPASGASRSQARATAGRSCCGRTARRSFWKPRGRFLWESSPKPSTGKGRSTCRRATGSSASPTGSRNRGNRIPGSFSKEA